MFQQVFLMDSRYARPHINYDCYFSDVALWDGMIQCQWFILVIFLLWWFCVWWKSLKQEVIGKQRLLVQTSHVRCQHFDQEPGGGQIQNPLGVTVKTQWRRVLCREYQKWYQWNSKVMHVAMWKTSQSCSCLICTVGVEPCQLAYAWVLIWQELTLLRY
jgi:hypothetical protein